MDFDAPFTSVTWTNNGVMRNVEPEMDSTLLSTPLEAVAASAQSSLRRRAFVAPIHQTSTEILVEILHLASHPHGDFHSFNYVHRLHALAQVCSAWPPSSGPLRAYGLSCNLMTPAQPSGPRHSTEPKLPDSACDSIRQTRRGRIRGPPSRSGLPSFNTVRDGGRWPSSRTGVTV